MHENPNPELPSASGAGGTLRAIASACIVLLAVLGILVVLEVIPRSLFAAMGGKVLAVAGIVLLASLAVGLVSRRR
jgi:hypothetical protein